MVHERDMLLYSVFSLSFPEITLHIHMHQELEGNALTGISHLQIQESSQD